MYLFQKNCQKNCGISRNFFGISTPIKGDRTMNQEFQQYRFARIEAQNITRARLEAQFRDGITDLEKLEKAIEQQLTTEPTCTPWRKSETERAGCREGMRMAALEFYWVHRRDLAVLSCEGTSAGFPARTSSSCFD
jgi:hypothetical protein